MAIRNLPWHIELSESELKRIMRESVFRLCIWKCVEYLSYNECVKLCREKGFEHVQNLVKEIEKSGKYKYRDEKKIIYLHNLTLVSFERSEAFTKEDFMKCGLIPFRIYFLDIGRFGWYTIVYSKLMFWCEENVNKALKCLSEKYIWFDERKFSIKDLRKRNVVGIESYKGRFDYEKEREIVQFLRSELQDVINKNLMREIWMDVISQLKKGKSILPFL